jgi:PEP-CTERM motif-containing protein
MSKVRRLLILCAVAAVVLIPQHAAASSITIRTGVDAALNPLGPNTADPFWQISVQSGPFSAAEVVNSEVICCGMQTAGAQARWISDSSVQAGSPNTGWGVGPVAVARRSFDLTGFNLATTSLTGNWRVADSRFGVFLNGILIPGTATFAFGFDADQALSAGPGFFVPGVNLLELRGNSVNSQWDGFWLDATVRDGIAAVPEPGTLTLLGLGIAGLRAARARRRATR